MMWGSRGRKPLCQLCLTATCRQHGELAYICYSKGDDNLTAPRKLGKNARIELRVTDQQKNYLVLKAAEQNKTLNDYVGNILQNYEYADKLTYIENIQKQKIKLLSNIANNLNQLARHCNSTNEAPQKDILLAMFDEIKKVR